MLYKTPLSLCLPSYLIFSSFICLPFSLSLSVCLSAPLLVILTAFSVSLHSLPASPFFCHPSSLSAQFLCLSCVSRFLYISFACLVSLSLGLLSVPVCLTVSSCLSPCLSLSLWGISLCLFLSFGTSKNKN